LAAGWSDAGDAAAVTAAFVVASTDAALHLVAFEEVGRPSLLLVHVV
jgi:hypothetical protein